MESNEYKKSIERLKADPVIIAMADELMEAGDFSIDSLSRYEQPSGTPRMAFMTLAMNEYHDRGGKIPTHIGGPARAVLAVIKEKVDAKDKEERA